VFEYYYILLLLLLFSYLVYLFHNFVCDCCRCSNINELSSFFVEDTLKSLSCSLPSRDVNVIKCPGFWLLKNGFPIHIPRPPPSKLVKCKHGSDTQIQYWVKHRSKVTKTKARRQTLHLFVLMHILSPIHGAHPLYRARESTASWVGERQYYALSTLGIEFDQILKR
jgi:hypothetical protein